MTVSSSSASVLELYTYTNLVHEGNEHRRVRSVEKEKHSVDRAGFWVETGLRHHGIWPLAQEEISDTRRSIFVCQI